MIIQGYNGRNPSFPKESCFIANSATLCGDVTLGEECSIWFNVVLRAEVAPIKIGSRSNVQDNSVIHTDEGFNVLVGDGVSIGHGAVLHGAQIGSNCLIGMCAILLNGCKVSDNCIVAAGSLITQGKEIPEGSLVMGSPAFVKRPLQKEEIEGIRVNAEHYTKFRAAYLKEERSKSAV